MYKIVAIIKEVCEKLGIPYKSPRHHTVDQFNEDVHKLADIYLQLKQIISELAEIESRYEKLNGLKEMFEKDINNLIQIDHDIIYEANKIAKKKKGVKDED